MTRKKIVIETIAVAFLCVTLAFFVIFLMDTDRMNHNEPVIFSTWGHKYAPPKSIGSNAIENAIENYIVDGNNNSCHVAENEKWFVSQQIYSIEKYKNGDVTVCTWIFAESYYKENSEIKSGGGFSAPYKFSLSNTDGCNTVNGYQMPRDGSYYKKDMLRIFKPALYLEMSCVHDDGTVARLNEQNKELAEKYFKDK